MESKKWFVNSYNAISADDRVNEFFKERFWLASLYHENSKYYPDIFYKQMPLLPYSIPKADIKKRYYEEYKIPSFEELNDKNAFVHVLKNRRSSWDFKGEEITFDELCKLLQYSFGITEVKKITNSKQNFVINKRTYPSGGALYSIDIYIYIQKVKGLKSGLYLFSPQLNELFLIKREKDINVPLNSIGISTDEERNPIIAEDSFEKASAVFMLSANFKYQTDKYGLRAYRLALMESGHIAQNILLVSTFLQKKSIPFTGFYDDRANNFLDLDGVSEVVLYMIPIG
ncbi:SagB family peptide dehydrogenase, partial [Bacillus velezensis]|uniref:SagB family peptide dehydrogenase n=1 Tax=Bacillus velezensis TaxID=492670 RepID=UPI0035A64A41